MSTEQVFLSSLGISCVHQQLSGQMKKKIFKSCQHDITSGSDVGLLWKSLETLWF